MTDEEQKILAESQMRAVNWNFNKYKQPELKTELETDLSEKGAVMVNERKADLARKKLGSNATEKQVLQEYIKMGGLVKYPNNKKKKYGNVVGLLYKN